MSKIERFEDIDNLMNGEKTMRVTKLHLVHFRSARELTIELDPKLNLLVGVNGAGKSTILDALAILLSWASARLRSPNAGGRRIVETDIHNEKAFSWLEISCQTDTNENNQTSWRIVQTRKGRNPDTNPSDPLHGITSLRSLNEWASNEREHMGQNVISSALPLFVYYPVNRSVLDIPLRIRKSHTFNLLDAYDDALTAGTNFRSFFEWYRDREDIENERLRDTGQLVEDHQLSAVRQAISAFLPDFSNISVKRNPLRMEVEKNHVKYQIGQLSDGEKCIFAMIGDLARRLAITNPNSNNPLLGNGIVLIDEIDLHLHPAWQRMVVPNLIKTFPNCQFIVSTHSPQIFGEVDAQSVRRLGVDPIHGLVASIPRQAFGLDSSEILDEEMEAKSRNQETANQLQEIFRLIDKEQFSDAKKQMMLLRKKLMGNIPELVRAESLIAMLEPEKEEHQ